MKDRIEVSDFKVNDFKIIKKNNSLKLFNLKIDKELSNISIVKLKEEYFDNKTNKTLILNNENKREVILIGSQNILIQYPNTFMFDTIHLPEIIDLYLKSNNTLTNEIKINKEYCNIYSINNNLYILNFEDKLLFNIKEYIYIINNKNNYKKEIEKDYIINKNNNQANNLSRAYSYGYINILLIALLISTITIMFCLLKY